MHIVMDMQISTPKANLQSYAACEKFVGDRASRKLCNHTYVRRINDANGDGYDIVFHKTAIVTFYKNGDIALDSGDWKSKSTRGRMNAFLPMGMRVDGKDGRGFDNAHVRKSYNGYDWRVRIENGSSMMTTVFRDKMILRKIPMGYIA